MADEEGEGTRALAALRASDPVLARLIDGLELVDISAWRARWALDSFRALARSIIGQQIATGAATAIRPRRSSMRPTQTSDRSACRRPRRRPCATSPHGRSMAGSISRGWTR